MVVKMWDLDESGNLTSSIRKEGQTGIRAEQSRPQAEALDREIDKLLDKAMNLLVQQDLNPRHTEFAKRWAIGRAIAESGVLDSPHMDPGERADLWRAMARKCRLGVRHTGKRNPKSRWKGLIPDREMEPKRIEDDIWGWGCGYKNRDSKTPSWPSGRDCTTQSRSGPGKPFGAGTSGTPSPPTSRNSGKRRGTTCT